MTTCVLSEGVLASDSRATMGSMPLAGDTVKLYQNEHTAVAIAGDLAPCLRIVRWILEDDADEESKPELGIYEDLVFQLIVVDKKTLSAYTYDPDNLDCVPVIQPVAIGSGMEAAMGALHALKLSKLPLCARTAVKAAMQCDIYSGGKVKSINLNKKPKASKK